MRLEDLEKFQARGPKEVEVVSVTGDNPEPEQAPVYENIYEIPPAWHTYRGARLSVEQINEIMADAYDKKIKTGDGAPIPDYGGAKERFEKKHEIQEGFWIEKGEGD